MTTEGTVTVYNDKNEPISVAISRIRSFRPVFCRPDMTDLVLGSPSEVVRIQGDPEFQAQCAGRLMK